MHEQLLKLYFEEKRSTKILKEKTENYKNAKSLLNSLVSPEMLILMDAFIEGTPVEQQFCLKLMDLFLNNSSSLMDEAPSLSLYDKLLQTATELARRTNQFNPTVMDWTVLELLHNGISETQFKESPVDSIEMGQYMTNGQKSETSPAPSGVVNSNHFRSPNTVPSVAAPQPFAGGVSAAPPAAPNAVAAPAQLAGPPAPAYMTYQGAPPPVPGPSYYAQAYPVASPHITGTNQTTAPVRMVATYQTGIPPNVPPTATAAPTPRHNGQIYGPYVPGRYTQHYYMPYHHDRYDAIYG